MIVQPPTPAGVDLEAAAQNAEVEALAAAGAFGTALRASPEFARLLAANEVLTADADATAAIDALGRRQAELRMETAFGTLDPSQQQELEDLRAAMLASSSVAAYIAAQNEFQAVCRETAAVVSAQIGIDFAANCRSGSCCG